jgi:hypothetical protein
MVDLPVPNDTIWDSMSSFQRFLWYADEMEHRWYTLTAAYKIDGSTGAVINNARSSNIRSISNNNNNDITSPTFLQATWSNKTELKTELDHVRQSLGCEPLDSVANVHRHVDHQERTLNCTSFIQQDFEYRRLMEYKDNTIRRLVSNRYPQHVDSKECVETRQELEEAIKLFSTEAGKPYDESMWVLPKH